MDQASKNAELNPRGNSKTSKHERGNIMLWGCFYWRSVGPLIWVKRNMDQHLFGEILSEIMLPYAEQDMPLNWPFQQDKDPKPNSGLKKKVFT